MTARLVPEEALPPYTYVPGRSPHPESDPAGHSFGRARTVPPPLDPARWADSRAYLRGLDLFNHGFYWESHEAWEGLWHAAGRRGPSADFLKGLIRLAAAGVKHREEKAGGVRSHAAAAARLFRTVAGQLPAAAFCGLCLADLAALAESIVRQGWPAPPPLLWPGP